MYTIHADDTLIYDSTLEDYKISKGSGTLEVGAAGSFSFSIYPDHPYYDRFVKKKTVITVRKSGWILFRGRVLEDKVNMQKVRELTCEGELNFLQDSIIRPYTFSGTPEEAFRKFLTEHNEQVDEFKQFRLGQCTVIDANNYIARSNTNYETTLQNLTSRLLEDATGGYLYITHGDDGTDPIPTLNYLADFPEISTQTIEFGVNLTDYLKKTNGSDLATAIIPLGSKIDDGNSDTEDPRLTIASVNDNVDYVYDPDAVAKHGWIFDTVIFDDVTLPENLKTKGLTELAQRIREDVSLTLTAVDLHLLDRTIESFRYGTYIRVISQPHNFAETLLCTKQTFDLLKPQNDTVTLGSNYSTFTRTVASTATKSTVAASQASNAQQAVISLDQKTAAYKIAEQRLTSLLAQSFGIFKTERVLEDGSTVFYMHDRPELDGSTNIWKMTGDAFAVSSDGGQTWNAGMDTSGNAVMNILSVIGINASWINADNLSAISANLGGWMIDEHGLYRELIDEDDENTKFRISLEVPSLWDVTVSTGKPVIHVQASTDGGEYVDRFSVTAQGEVIIKQGTNEGHYKAASAVNKIDNYGCAHMGWNGFYIENPDIKVLGLSPRAYFKRRELTADSVVDLYADGTVYGAQVRSGDGQTGNITLGGIKMTFSGGILTGATNV